MFKTVHLGIQYGRHRKFKQMILLDSLTPNIFRFRRWTIRNLYSGGGVLAWSANWTWFWVMQSLVRDWRLNGCDCRHTACNLFHCDAAQTKDFIQYSCSLGSPDCDARQDTCLSITGDKICVCGLVDRRACERSRSGRSSERARGTKSAAQNPLYRKTVHST